jgi:hypothetical protein
MRFVVMLLFTMLLIGTARLRVGKGLNKNEGSSVHDPSDEVSVSKAPEAKAPEAKAPEATWGCKNGLATPDAPMSGGSDLSINEANGFAAKAMFAKNIIN